MTTFNITRLPRTLAGLSLYQVQKDDDPLILLTYEAAAILTDTLCEYLTPGLPGSGSMEAGVSGFIVSSTSLADGRLEISLRPITEGLDSSESAVLTQEEVPLMFEALKAAGFVPDVGAPEVETV